jgi:hypothetical protein
VMRDRSTVCHFERSRVSRTRKFRNWTCSRGCRFSSTLALHRITICRT